MSENQRKNICINVPVSTIEYFKKESARTGIPYQTLMNLRLAECAEKGMHVNASWETT